MPLRKSIDLLIQQPAELLRPQRIFFLWSGDLFQRRSRLRLSKSLSTRPKSDMKGHAMQPAGQGLTAPDGAGTAGQGQEGCLESVLGILFLTQNTPTNAKNQSRMAPNQHSESRLVAACGETAQKIGVRRN